MIAAMETANLVYRQRDPADRRKQKVYLTDAGRDLEAQLMPLAREVNAVATEGINPEDLDTCRSVMRQMLKNLAAHNG